MAVNPVEIANLALGNIRARSIQSFDEDSLEAQTIKLRYDLCRRWVLQEIMPNFAKKTLALGLTTEQDNRWIYCYDYPADCLKVQYILPNWVFGEERTVYLRFGYEYPMDKRIELIKEHAEEFEIEQKGTSKVIMTNIDEAYATYIKDEEDTNLFTAQFAEALAWWLSAQIAVPVVGAEKGREMRRDALNIYSQMVREAKESLGNERRVQPEGRSELTIQREW